MSTEGERAGTGDLPKVDAAKELAKLYLKETGLVAICLLKGFLIAAGFWLLLYGFHKVTEAWKLEGFAPELLELIHDYGVAIAFVLILPLRAHAKYVQSESCTPTIPSVPGQPDDLLRRLGDVVDGSWLESVPGAPNLRRPKAATINLALAAELLSRLERRAVSDPAGVRSAVLEWLDPISGTSVASDILAPALSICVAKRGASDAAVASAVLTALLQSQNVGEHHRREVKALAPAIVEPLLDAIERSSSRAQASARDWALESVRRISRDNADAWTRADNRLVEWIARVKCPGEADYRRQEEFAQHVSKGLISRIGTDKAGSHRVMGLPVRLDPEEEGSLGDLVPVLLRGRALRPSIRVLVAAAVVMAIGNGGHAYWEGLRWVVLFNEADGPLTNATLEHLSKEALKVNQEPGLHPEFAKRVAALLLWLTQVERNEVAANGMRASFEHTFTYDKDYLEDPSRSLFVLERRHAQQALDDQGVHLGPRLRRAELYLPDPELKAPQSLLDALSRAASGVEVDLLDRHLSHTEGPSARPQYVASRFMYAILLAGCRSRPPLATWH